MNRKLISTASILILTTVLTFGQSVIAPKIAEATVAKGICTWKAINKTTGAIRTETSANGILETGCVEQDTPTERWTEPHFQQTGAQQQEASVDGTPPWFESIFKVALSGLANAVMGIVSLITGIAATLLNGAVYYTVVNVSKNYQNLSSIATTWVVIRDIGNIAFIFVLVYAGIQTIIGRGGDYKRLITNVVLAAILVNFSLFFTRIIIDISNVLSITFYDAIAPGALNATGGFNVTQAGLATAFASKLHLQDIYKIKDSITVGGIFTVGVMGSIMLLIAAFSFFAVAILFIIRYVVLILVMILSPIYFLSMIVPSGTGLAKTVGGWASQWQNALFGQAFFAPIYFFMTWLSLRILSGVSDAMGGGTAVSGPLLSGSVDVNNGVGAIGQDMFSVFINFAIVIILMIASLIVAKDYASRAGKGVSQITNWVSGLGFGGASLAGRLTVGAASEAFSGTRAYKTLEKKSKDGGASGMASRLTLAATDKLRRSSFDARGSRVGGIFSDSGASFGKPTGTGGFEADKKAFREFFEKEGTEAYKKRQERARKADNELIITDSAGQAVLRRFDALIERENNLISEEKAIKAAVKVAGGVETAEQTSRLTAITNEKRGIETEKDGLNNQVSKMEQTIARASDKEIEAIVDSNRELLKNQQFANRLSAKQLEALNKSDKFAESDKEALRSNRFAPLKGIDNADGLAALKKKPADRNQAEAIAAGKVEAAKAFAKGLTDGEIEMLDPEWFENDSFITALKSSQIESINKNNKFTKRQRATIKKKRIGALLNALDISRPSHNPDKELVKEMATKTLTAEDLAGLAGEKIKFRDELLDGAEVEESILLSPGMMEHYNPKLLKNMAVKLSQSDIQSIRNKYESISNRVPVAGAAPIPKSIQKVINWLDKPDGENNF